MDDQNWITAILLIFGIFVAIIGVVAYLSVYRNQDAVKSDFNKYTSFPSHEDEQEASKKSTETFEKNSHL